MGVGPEAKKNELADHFVLDLRCGRILALVMSSWNDDILNFKIGPREIESRLLRIGQIDADERMLRQYHDYDLNDAAECAFLDYMEALEAKEYDAALLISERLFKLPFLQSVSKGFVALAVVELDAVDRPIASVVREATPFARVNDNDWAFYLALAKLKRRCNHPLMAHCLISLAKAVPFHHPALVNREMSLIIRSRTQNYNNGAKVLPRLLSNPYEIMNTFLNSEEMRYNVLEWIRTLKEEPEALQAMREEHPQLQRLVSRAERRYYINDWHILEHPSQQWGSAFANLPLDFTTFLNLASTCKIVHNTFHDRELWRDYLEKDWDLDLSYFDQYGPRNIKLIVKQVQIIFNLPAGFWLSRGDQPLPLATERLLSRSMMPLLTKSDSTEACWRLLATLVVADRLGRLTTILASNGIVEFILSTIKTDPNEQHVELALDLLSLFYLRNRRTCALVSSTLSPTLAKVLALVQMNSLKLSRAAHGLYAAASASQILYYGAVSAVIPNPHSLEKGLPPDYSRLLRPQPFDFQATRLGPSPYWLDRTGLLVNDDLDPRLNEALQKPASGFDRTHHNLLHVDPQRAQYAPNYSKLVEAINGDEGEWWIYIVFPGTATESVLHRGLIRARMSFLTDSSRSSHLGHLNGQGYWTIGPLETADSITEDTILGAGRYGDSSHREYYDEASWNSNHSITLDSWAFDLREGYMHGTIERLDGAAWTLSGTLCAIGYLGSISTETSHGIETFAGFTLLKSQGDGSHLHAYSRIAQLPHLVGPLSDPIDSAFPRELSEPLDEEDDQDLDALTQLEMVRDVASQFVSSAANRSCFIDLIHDQTARLGKVPDRFDALFAVDYYTELSGSGWHETRRLRAGDLLIDLDTIRTTVALTCRDEVELDLEIMEPFCSLQKPRSERKLLKQQINMPITGDVFHRDAQPYWEVAQTASLKWASRLLFFELAGLNSLSAMQFIYSFLQGVKILAESFKSAD